MGLFVAAVVVATMIKSPTFLGAIYFNMGESMIYLAALLLGRNMGAIAGGIGAAMGDILLGYPVWAPITFILKGLEGDLVGAASKGKSLKSDILAVCAGAPVIIIGYALTAGLFYGKEAILPELLIDITQVTVGALVAIPLARSLRCTSLFRDDDCK